MTTRLKRSPSVYSKYVECLRKLRMQVEPGLNLEERQGRR